jgi:hypothetical protein
MGTNEKSPLLSLSEETAGKEGKTKEVFPSENLSTALDFALVVHENCNRVWVCGVRVYSQRGLR